MKRILLYLAICGALYAHAGENLWQNNSSAWRIVIPAQSSAPEKYAAEELSRMVKKISGVQLPVTASDTVPAKNAIVIGSLATSRAIREANAKLLLQTGAVENIAVHTIGDNLYLAGNNPRGALYAVYDFLQRELGVRWLWPGDDGEFFPTIKEFRLPELKRNYQPPIRFREMTPCYEQKHIPTQIWLARNFLNGGARTTNIRDNGGFFRQDGQHWVTLPKKDFARYPEYFSLIGGKRVVEGQAGCWSNPDFLKLMVDKHVKLIKDNNFELLKTIHADITQRCECPECTRNPDPASRWFEFYDKLAAEISKSCPGVLFAGSAYQEHRKVPVYDIKNLAYVEYCHYNRCYIHKLSDRNCKLNQRSMAELQAWQKKIPMAVYGYELDVFEPFMYVPLWNILADELAAFRDLGVVRVKTELPVIHKKSGRRADDALQKLRIANYIYAQTAWNPAADTDKLLRDFCRTAYGPGADAMYAYHVAMASAWEKMPIHLSYFLSNPSGASAKFLSAKLMAFAKDKFTAARQAATATPDAVQRSRFLANIQIDADLFADWEKLHRVTGVDAVCIVPKLADATKLADFKSLPMPSKRDSALPTECRMYWSDDALHIQLVCMMPDMKKLRPGATGRDVTLWTDDNIEIFLDLNDGNSYRHLAANPAGGKFDAIADDASWNPQWESKTRLLADRWIMDITLPFSSFGSRPVTDGAWWKIMVIRNGKPGPCGYPAAAHHDMSRGATLCFSNAATPEKNLLWLSSPNLSGGKRFVKIMPELLKRGWRFDNAANPAEAELKDPALAEMIVVERYQNKLPASYYREKIIPAVRNGAVLVLSCYFWTDDLAQLFGDESFAVKFVENAAKLRKITYVQPGVFAGKPHNFRKILRFPPSGTLVPRNPDKWQTLAAQATKDGSSAPFIIGRKLGKGMVVVAGDIKENIQLLENILYLNSTDTKAQ